MQNARWILISGAALGLMSVILGAFSTHVLKSILDQYSLAIFETAARYQMYHALALLVCGLASLNNNFSAYWLKLAGIAFIGGTLLFSGSLYVLALTGIKWLGALTPIGGVGFILGWCFMIVVFLKIKSSKI